MNFPRLKHIREQKDLLEKQKQQLIEQQRKLDEQLTMKIGERNAANAAVSAAEVIVVMFMDSSLFFSSLP